jgi:hypothetical protein
LLPLRLNWGRDICQNQTHYVNHIETSVINEMGRLAVTNSLKFLSARAMQECHAKK